MPRKSKDNVAARGKAAVIDESRERGLAMRMLLHSPKDLVAGLAAFAAITAIVANALFLQAGRHPSPMFGAAVAIPLAAPQANPLPRPRPIEAATRPAEPRVVETKPAEKPVDAKPADHVGNLLRAGNAPAATASVPRPPAPVPAARSSDPVGDLIASTRRITSVQRALTEYGYGQLKPTGNVGPDTQAAIQKFERERKLPVTGQVSDRLVRELSATTGRSID